MQPAEVLGLDPDEKDQKAIRLAYERKLAAHPLDTDPESFREITEAYEALTPWSQYGGQAPSLDAPERSQDMPETGLALSESPMGETGLSLGGTELRLGATGLSLDETELSLDEMGSSLGAGPAPGPLLAIEPAPPLEPEHLPETPVLSAAPPASSPPAAPTAPVTPVPPVAAAEPVAPAAPVTPTAPVTPRPPEVPIVRAAPAALEPAAAREAEPAPAPGLEPIPGPMRPFAVAAALPGGEARDRALVAAARELAGAMALDPSLVAVWATAILRYLGDRPELLARAARDQDLLIELQSGRDGVARVVLGHAVGAGDYVRLGLVGQRVLTAAAEGNLPGAGEQCLRFAERLAVAHPRLAKSLFRVGARRIPSRSRRTDELRRIGTLVKAGQQLAYWPAADRAVVARMIETRQAPLKIAPELRRRILFLSRRSRIRRVLAEIVPGLAPAAARRAAATVGPRRARRKQSPKVGALIAFAVILWLFVRACSVVAPLALPPPGKDLVHQHARGEREVERVDVARHGDADRHVAESALALREAAALAAQHRQDRPPVGERAEVAARLGGRADDEAAGAAFPGPQLVGASQSGPAVTGRNGEPPATPPFAGSRARATTIRLL